MTSTLMFLGGLLLGFLSVILGILLSWMRINRALWEERPPRWGELGFHGREKNVGGGDILESKTTEERVVEFLGTGSDVENDEDVEEAEMAKDNYERSKF
jgi:hypothetical protein